MNVQITEHGYECIALVRDDDGALSLWARHDHGDWAYLGTMRADGRSLDASIVSADIAPLARQMAALDDAFEAYSATLPSA